MADQEKILDINYEKLSMTNPRSFVDYALELNKHISTNFGPITRISYVCGTHKKQGYARITVNEFNEVLIETPEDSINETKLANLLWALSRCGVIPSHILYSSSEPTKYDVTSKHLTAHTGDLQEKIKKAMNLAEFIEPSVMDIKKRVLFTRDATPEQISEYNDMPKDKQELWHKFSRYSNRDGKIPFEIYMRLEKELGLPKEEIFELNESFERHKIGFDIDYGNVTFATHYFELRELRKENERLQKEKADLEALLFKKKE
jgi:hypothetical protein